MNYSVAEPETDDLFVLATLGVAAYVLADTMHEAIGHGLMCLATGGHIQLLTSAFFRSEPGSVWGAHLTDAAGPVANLLLGGCTLWATHRGRTPHAHLLLTLTAAFNLAWGSGYLLYSAVLNTGDWVFAVRGWPYQPIWRAGFGVAGVALYYTMLRATAARLRGTTTPQQLRRRLLVPYLAASAAAVGAALCYTPNRTGALIEALQESALANVGLVWLALTWRPEPMVSSASSITGHWRLVAAIGVGWAVFAASLGRGLLLP